MINFSSWLFKFANAGDGWNQLRENFQLGTAQQNVECLYSYTMRDATLFA